MRARVCARVCVCVCVCVRPQRSEPQPFLRWPAGVPGPALADGLSQPCLRGLSKAPSLWKFQAARVLILRVSLRPRGDASHFLGTPGRTCLPQPCLSRGRPPASSCPGLPRPPGGPLGRFLLPAPGTHTSGPGNAHSRSAHPRRARPQQPASLRPAQPPELSAAPLRSRTGSGGSAGPPP